MKEDSGSRFIKNVLETGSVMAMIISWSIHKSVLWAVIHGLLSWFYVFHYLINK